MNDILSKIIEHKKWEIRNLDYKGLRFAAEHSPFPRDFVSAVRSTQPGGPVRLIAELKRASPSKGLLAPNIDLYQVADIYSKNGAAAISVLTDEKYFLGKLETLRELRYTRSMTLPLLRKDFMIDEVQLYEARTNGADAVLLIVAALKDQSILAALHACALSLGLTPVVEVHDPAEIERALRLKNLKVIGINNRNLSTFEVSLAATEQLRPLVPDSITVLAESGIFTAGDVLRVAKAGVDAVLVGEALVTAGDIAEKVRELASVTVNP
jgi:indole-3-glycerol phosphate synthase